MKYISIFSLLLALASCKGFENNIEIVLPEYERQLVVECYLEPGKPYHLVLSESQGYFDSFDAFPFVSGAVCVIEHNGVYDTLAEALNVPVGPLPFLPFLNEDTTKFYNYASLNSICPLDYDNDFHLYITDGQGRTITGTTRMLPPIQLDTLTATYNNDSTLVAMQMKFYDPAGTVDFYRPLMYHNGMDSLPVLDFTVDDARFLNGEYVVFGTGYEFERGDTITASLYHIEKAYHDFRETIRDAIQSNGNPFAQPGRILNTVEGGMGVFTFLSYDRMSMIIP